MERGAISQIQGGQHQPGGLSSAPGPGRILDIVSGILAVVDLVNLGCGALAARLDATAGTNRTPVAAGATGGAALWVISFLVNLLLTLLLGAPSLGVSLLVGIPYLCLCSPVELLLGGILGSFGGLIYGLFSSRRDPPSNYGW